jgi:cation diffusion facilitator family transporter
LLAWAYTNSAALLADALESVVNVFAAAFAFWAIRVSSRPADSDHPYGHGKIELISAAFEGGLVILAAVWVIVTATFALAGPHFLHELYMGIGVSAVAGVVNFALGLWLIQKGRAHGSPALTADGKHVLSDVVTTAVAILGLFAVTITGLNWLDAALALALGSFLAATGAGLVKQAIDGLMDREDPELLRRIRTAFETLDIAEVHGLHRLRAMQSGNRVHVDAHVHVPATWTVEQAHAAVVNVERSLKAKAGIDGDIVLHLDPYPPPPSEINTPEDHA